MDEAQHQRILDATLDNLYHEGEFTGKLLGGVAGIIMGFLVGFSVACYLIEITCF